MELLIPQHISKIGLYTGQTLLISFVVSIYYNYSIICSIALLTTYITTMLYWRKIYKQGIIKTLDMLSVLNLIVSFYYTGLPNFTPMCQHAWISSIAISGIAFGINAYIFYHQTTNNKWIMKPGFYSYFSLAYTLPNTRERELCYYYSTIVHCMFLHVLCNSISIYCA